MNFFHHASKEKFLHQAVAISTYYVQTVMGHFIEVAAQLPSFKENPLITRSCQDFSQVVLFYDFQVVIPVFFTAWVKICIGQFEVPAISSPVSRVLTAVAEPPKKPLYFSTLCRPV